MLSRAAIRRKCAFTYMNAVSRKNLTDARAQLTRTTCAPRSTQAPHSAVSPASCVSPDDRDLHMGRERPPEGRAWGEEGGSQMGVAHAPLTICSAATTASTATPAAQSAAGSEAPIYRLAGTCTVRISAIGAMTLVTVQRDGLSVGGTMLPSFGSHHLFPLGSMRRGQPGWDRGSSKASELESRSAYRTRRIVLRAAADLDRPGPLRRRTTAAGSLTGTNRWDG